MPEVEMSSREIKRIHEMVVRHTLVDAIYSIRIFLLFRRTITLNWPCF
jgi:hypothetical protein